MTKREQRTDYLGTYMAYVFDDGHVETDPPNRPVSKEDVQRERSSASFRPYQEALFRINKLAATSTAQPGAVQALLRTVSLGGEIAGDPRPKYETVNIDA